jgi:heat shock protein HslJ
MPMRENHLVTWLQLGLMIVLAAIPNRVQSAQGGAGSQEATIRSGALQGTKWQLVKFVGGDDGTLTPDDPAKYTIEFAAGGRLVARVDCNRGRGTWKTVGSSQLEFGPMALTRAKCPEGSDGGRRDLRVHTAGVNALRTFHIGSGFDSGSDSASMRGPLLPQRLPELRTGRMIADG